MRDTTGLQDTGLEPGPLAVPFLGGSPTELPDVTSRDEGGTTSDQDNAATTRKPSPASPICCLGFGSGMGAG